MSAPEPRDEHKVAVSGGEVTRAPVKTGLTRVERATRWVGTRLGELVGVSVPAGLAVTVSPWFAPVAGFVGAWWAVNEWRSRRAAAPREEGERS